MKIAVTYEGGSIFQHFGKTETFKMYEVEDGKITSMQIVHTGWSDMHVHRLPDRTGRSKIVNMKSDLSAPFISS